MGRKGVSKRKPKQNKSNPFSKDKSVGSVSSALQPVETATDKSIGSGTAASSANRKKKSRKG